MVNLRPLLRPVLRRGYYLGQRILNGRWFELKREANGMLRPSVYKAIYNHVKKAQDLDIVEIGGAHGASSIAIAKAMQDAGIKSNLVVVERCERGSRERYGDYNTNLGILERNFEKFGVSNKIKLYPHGLTDDTAEDVLKLIGTDQIAGFMHDADGWLDRDFFYFWPRTVPGGLIIVDDYPTSTKTTHEKKHRTYFLLNRLMDWGLFEPVARHHDTMIGRKPLDADWSVFDRAACVALMQSAKSGVGL